MQLHTIFQRGSEQYPHRLLILCKPPEVIYVQGKLELAGKTAAVVGTHEATADGVKTAYRIGQWLGQHQVTVISGLARGIDTGGHTGCLDGGGRTVAVLGSGLGNVYPPENRGLAERITHHGAVITEYGPEMRTARWQLVARNRIIAALADIIVVVEPWFNRAGKMEVLEQGRLLGRKMVAIDAYLSGKYRHVQSLNVMDALCCCATWLNV
jgi:DNA processing protein